MSIYDYEDEVPQEAEEEYALVPVQELRRMESVSLGIFQKKMAFHLVCNLSNLDNLHTHPKIDALLGAACSYLECWFDGTNETF